MSVGGGVSAPQRSTPLNPSSLRMRAGRISRAASQSISIVDSQGNPQDIRSSVTSEWVWTKRLSRPLGSTGSGPPCIKDILFRSRSWST